jgi:hypothetical protein
MKLFLLRAIALVGAAVPALVISAVATALISEASIRTGVYIVTVVVFLAGYVEMIRKHIQECWRWRECLGCGVISPFFLLPD